jgi:hypothetical protein
MDKLRVRVPGPGVHRENKIGFHPATRPPWPSLWTTGLHLSDVTRYIVL